jgi:hypothetical protein
MNIYFPVSDGSLGLIDVVSEENSHKVGAIASLDIECEALFGEGFDNQEGYVELAAKAAFMAFNPRHQQKRYSAEICVSTEVGDFTKMVDGSCSSTLSYSLALFNTWWQSNLERRGIDEKVTLVASGCMTASGDITSVSGLKGKLVAIKQLVLNGRNQHITAIFPESNQQEVEAEIQSLSSDDAIALSSVQFIYPDSLPYLLKKLITHYDGAKAKWQPFKGLLPFGYEDAMRFFGRDDVIKRLENDFQKNKGVMIVSGASGSGKTSVLQAGFMPRYEAQLNKEGKKLVHCRVTPSELIDKGGFDKALNQTLIKSGIEGEWSSIKPLKNSDEWIKCLSPCLHKQQLLIHFDQFEETFTILETDTESIQWLTFIQQVINADINVRFIISLRAEYDDILRDSEALNSPKISKVSSKLNTGQWEELIHEQALFSGIQFEDGLVKLIIEEAVSQDNNLPMVELLLEQMYKKAQAENNKGNINKLSYHHYWAVAGFDHPGKLKRLRSRLGKTFEPNSLTVDQCIEYLTILIQQNAGPLTQVIESHAEQALSKVKIKGSLDDILPKLFFELVHHKSGDAEKASRKHMPLERFKSDDDIKAIITALRAESLLLHVGDSLVFAHDSLVLRWGRIQNWLAENHEFIEWRKRIDQDFRQWLSVDKDKSRLLPKGLSIEQAKSNIEKFGRWLPDEIISYIELSYSTRQRRTWFFRSTVFIIFLSLSFSTWFSVVQKSVAQKQTVELLNARALVIPKIEAEFGVIKAARESFKIIEANPDLVPDSIKRYFNHTYQRLVPLKSQLKDLGINKPFVWRNKVYVNTKEKVLKLSEHKAYRIFNLKNGLFFIDSRKQAHYYNYIKKEHVTFSLTKFMFMQSHLFNKKDPEIVKEVETVNSAVSLYNKLDITEIYQYKDYILIPVMELFSPNEARKVVYIFDVINHELDFTLPSLILPSIEMQNFLGCHLLDITDEKTVVALSANNADCFTILNSFVVNKLHFPFKVNEENNWNINQVKKATEKDMWESDEGYYLDIKIKKKIKHKSGYIIVGHAYKRGMVVCLFDKNNNFIKNVIAIIDKPDEQQSGRCDTQVVVEPDMYYFSENNQYLLVSTDKMMPDGKSFHVYNLKDGLDVTPQKQPERWSDVGVFFSDSNQTLIIKNDGGLWVYKLKRNSGYVYQKVIPHTVEHDFYQVEFIAENKVLILAFNGQFSLLDVELNDIIWSSHTPQNKSETIDDSRRMRGFYISKSGVYALVEYCSDRDCDRRYMRLFDLHSGAMLSNVISLNDIFKANNILVHKYFRIDNIIISDKAGIKMEVTNGENKFLLERPAFKHKLSEKLLFESISDFGSTKPYLRMGELTKNSVKNKQLLDIETSNGIFLTTQPDDKEN